jgi:hypothetical protein
MDWKAIANGCGNAFRALTNWAKNTKYKDSGGILDFGGVICIGLNEVGYNKAAEHQFNPRDLYDFFDTQEIFIAVEIAFAIDNSFNFHIAQHIAPATLHTIWNPTVYPTRTQAEEAAFTRAFEILENKLK